MTRSTDQPHDPSSPSTGQQLEVAEARFRALFDHAQVGVVLADAESYYLDANPVACRMLGYTREELVGLHASDIVVQAEVPRVASALAEIHGHIEHQRDWQLRRKDGSTLAAEVTATKMADGTLLGMLRDVSDRTLAHDYREHLVALVESSADAIIGIDLNGAITSWNTGAEQIFGYTAAAMIGKPIATLIPNERRAEEQQILNRLRAGERVARLDTVRTTNDGRMLDVQVTVSPIRDHGGRVVGASGISRDVTALKQREREVDRLSRLYAALSHINQAILSTPTREELFDRVCRVLVEDGGFAMSWIGWHDLETQRLIPVARHGDATGYVDEIVVYADDRPEGRGPSGEAFRSGEPYICNDLSNDPAGVPWRDARERHDIRAAAALPIRLNGHVRGTLQVYARQRAVFNDKEVALLTEAVGDVSFALDNFERSEARRQAEIAVRNEQAFSNAMIESMPGIFYLYDTHGRFLRWNRNFATVSGYSDTEIAAMHPRDFFPAADWPRVEERIGEVFAKGEATVEATFTAKNGAATPYFFTGRRVQVEGQTCLVGVGIDISDRRRAERRLEERERSYRELVEYANSIILRWTPSGLITFMNEFGLRFFGYSAEELLGKPVTGTIVPATESGGRDLRHLMDEICAAPETFERNVNENVRRNGERVWIAWTNRIVRDAAGRIVELMSVGTDITAQRRADEKLRESEARLSEAQRIAQIGSWEFDIRSGRLAWSAQAHAIFGLRPDDFKGTYEEFMSFVHPEDLARVQQAQQAALAAQSRLDIEHRIVLRDGTEKIVHVLADLKRDAAGRPLALAGTAHDITDRTRVAIEREKRHRAEAADRVKSAFLAAMSHELRTPLNSIIGFTGIVLQGLAGPLNVEQSKQLGMVRESARHLLALVNDILDISKIEAGQLEVARQSFDLRHSIEKVTALVAPQIDAKHLDFVVQLAPDLDEAVNDERRFEQVLLNLLSNAVKFTERGRVTLAATRVDDFTPTDGEPSGPGVQLQVSDTGIGIRPEHLASLFQPFRQIDSGLSRRHEGTGLGLVISQRLAMLMGGNVRAESQWGKGSTFTVTLPLRRAVQS